jgi:glycosyltransferase involved in cell wall biosynthesis
MSDVTPPSPGAEGKPQIKVLLVDASVHGGIATYTDKLQQALRNEGIEVVRAAPEGQGDQGAILADRRWGPDVEGMSRVDLYRLRLSELGPSAYRLLRTVNRIRPDIVHVQTDVVPGIDHLVLRLIARRYPVVITAHDPDPQEGGDRELADQARRWKVADAVIIHGHEPLPLVESRAGNTPIFVVPVDLMLGGPSGSRQEARRRLDLPEGPLALLLGLLRPYKGLALLSETWPKVVAEVPGARLLLVGDSYESPELAVLERLPGVEVRRGFIPEEELDWWAAAADVLVLAYLHGSHSGVLHRGLAAGTPVLASPVLREEVERTGAGRAVPMEPALWADALTEVLGSHPLPKPPAPGGGLTAAGTIDVYRQVLDNRARASRAELKNPVRVVYFVEGYTFGGVERHLLHLLDELDRDRFEPMVLGVMADELEQEVTARQVPLVRLERIRGNSDIQGFLRAARAVHQARPVVFHAMLSHSYAAQYALMAAIAMRTPAVVITAHLPTASDSRWRVRLGRLILRRVDVQVLPSEWTRSELSRMGQLHLSTEVVANGIALPTLFSRDEARQKLGIAPGATVIGGSMRLVDWKRPELVIEAARWLPDAVVVLLGEGPEEDRLRALSQGVDLRLPGFRLDAVSLLPAFDVMVHPCPTDNQPLAVLEAMATGLPVVVADEGGAALLVEDGRTGLLAPATPEGMAAAVRRLIEDPTLAARVAAAGQTQVQARFSTQTMTTQLEDLYDHLLGIQASEPVGAT